MYWISTSGNTILKESLWYLYEKCTYIIKPGEVNQESCEIVQLDKPLKDKYITKYTKHKNYTVLITLEWIGAPKSFLNSWKFKQLQSSNYIESIKESRKNNKKKK